LRQIHARKQREYGRRRGSRQWLHLGLQLDEYDRSELNMIDRPGLVAIAELLYGLWQSVYSER
jgi:hypothetical protein